MTGGNKSLRTQNFVLSLTVDPEENKASATLTNSQTGENKLILCPNRLEDLESVFGVSVDIVKRWLGDM